MDNFEVEKSRVTSDGPYERETIISFCDAENTASYYTCNRSKMEKLRKLAKEKSEEVKIIRDTGWCVEAMLPKKWVKIRPPRILTEEQQAEMSRRGKEAYEKYLKNRRVDDKADSDVPGAEIS